MTVVSERLWSFLHFYHNLTGLSAYILFAAVIWGFPCDGNIVRMALGHSGIGDSAEFCFVQLIDGTGAAIAYSCEYAADQPVTHLI